MKIRKVSIHHWESEEIYRYTLIIEKNSGGDYDIGLAKDKSSPDTFGDYKTKIYCLYENVSMPEYKLLRKKGVLEKILLDASQIEGRLSNMEFELC